MASIRNILSRLGVLASALFATLLVLLSAAAVRLSGEFPREAAQTPRWVGIALLVLLVPMCLQEWRLIHRGRRVLDRDAVASVSNVGESGSEASSAPGDASTGEATDRAVEQSSGGGGRRSVILAITTFLSVAVLNAVGLLIVGTVFLLTTLILFRVRIGQAFLVAAVFAAVVQVFFGTILGLRVL